MGLFHQYLDTNSKIFIFHKMHSLKKFKGNHYWEFYILPAFSVYSCSSNFIELEISFRIKWFNYELITQIELKKKK